MYIPNMSNKVIPKNFIIFLLNLKNCVTYDWIKITIYFLSQKIFMFMIIIANLQLIYNKEVIIKQ